jgi:hypothetical protein
MLLFNTQNSRDTEYALSISPVLVLDDNTRICKRNKIIRATSFFEQGAKLPSKCVHPRETEMKSKNTKFMFEEKPTNIGATEICIL